MYGAPTRSYFWPNKDGFIFCVLLSFSFYPPVDKSYFTTQSLSITRRVLRCSIFTLLSLAWAILSESPHIIVWDIEYTYGSVSFKKWSFWWNKLSESGNTAVQTKRASLHYQCVSMYIIFTETPSFVLIHFWTIFVKDEQICTDFTTKG